jgi:hypothetical protein
MAYSEKLKDPRWQKKRLEIMQRDEFKCQICFHDDRTLHIHHYFYENYKEPWDYDNDTLITLCETCHSREKEARTTAESRLLDILKKRKFNAVDLFLLSDGFEVINSKMINKIFSILVLAVCKSNQHKLFKTRIKKYFTISFSKKFPAREI